MKKFGEWFERHPEYLEQETKEFQRRSLRFRLNEDLLKKKGIVVFDGEVGNNGEKLAFRVIYPTGFPHIAPEVVYTGDLLDRHQNPYAANLCLLSDPTEWTQEMTGADLIERAVELIRLFAGGTEAVASREIDAPEPAGTYYPYTGPHCLIIATRFMPSGEWGHFQAVQIPGPGSFQCLLIELENPFNTSENWRIRDIPVDTPYPPFRGCWFRATDHPPFLNDFQEFEKWAAQNFKDFRYRLESTSKKNQKKFGKVVSAFSIIYPNEGPRRREFHDNWLTFVKVEKNCSILRSSFFNETEQFQRISHLKNLSRKSACIIGLGALGSPLAVNLAKSGIGRLLLVDPDTVEAGNIVRQNFDLRDVGMYKVQAIERKIRLLSSVTEVESAVHRLGSCDITLQQPTDCLPLLAEKISSCDLIVSTVGEKGVNYLVNEIGQELSISAIFAWVLNGAWGGRIFRSVPGGPCLRCYGAQLDSFPDIPEDPDTLPLYARGCGFPTFRGPGFDSLAVAVAAVRLATQVMLGDDGYPAPDFHLISCANRGLTGADYPWIRLSVVNSVVNCPACRK